MPHAFITIAIPFNAEFVGETAETVKRIGNPFEATFRAKLAKSGIVHFASLTIVPPQPSGQSAHLVIEMSADGDADQAIGALADALGHNLADALDAARVDGSAKDPKAFIADPRYRLNPGVGWFGDLGIVYTGTPGMTVRRILDEAELAKALTPILYQPDVLCKASALERLRAVREQIEKQADFKPLLTVETAPFLGGDQATPLGAAPAILGSLALGIFWPVTLLVVVGVLATIAYAAFTSSSFLGGVYAAIVGVFWTLVAFLVLIAGLAVGLLLLLRSRESADIPDDANPDPKIVAEIMARENAVIADDDDRQKGMNEAAGPHEQIQGRWKGELRERGQRLHGTLVSQNHLFGVSTMKPGRLRLFTLRLAFSVILAFAQNVFRPGFLGSIGTIHFARWVMLPGGQLLFYSNYGGSWESYLEDFITKAHAGLTGVWSNTIGFPRTRVLFLDGATDGDRFKRWARRQQHPTLAWYCAYPHLSTSRIRANAAIRQGLGATTESEARDWLGCFGSAPPTASKLEAGDIQAVLYSGLGRLKYSRALILRLGANSALNRAWLRQLEGDITTAEKVPEKSASIFAVSHSGLDKLGVSERVRASFPAPFQHGMHAAWRARLLGDIEEDAPDNWCWGGTADKAADALLLLYDESEEQLLERVAAECARAKKGGIDVRIIELAALPIADPPTNPREPFGFVDGISQPMIRGTPRALKYPNDVDHLMEPGEFILGYPDNRGTLPSTPTVPAAEDAGGSLPTVVTDASRQRPNFAVSEANFPRDLGCNGSYLVVRQLEQNVEAFRTFLEGAAKQLENSDQLAWVDKHPKETLADWIGAKMIGRWPNGLSMARHAYGGPKADKDKKGPTPDNRFRFGEDDPAGYNCPLSSHVRRANPRDSFAPGSADQRAITNRHRLLRMGRSYQQGEQAGILFMCLNADIERQFEFVQQSWCLATQFHGLDNEADPILGRNNQTTTMTIPTPKGPIRIEGLKKFITVRGGAYFFLPSRRAVRWLSQH